VRTKTITLIVTATSLFSLMHPCICDETPNPQGVVVFNQNTENVVEEIVVHARFLTGEELNDLQELLGVPAETLDQESAASSRELFLVLRIKASAKARGVPCSVKLELVNDSPLVQQAPMIEFAPLHPDETQIRIVKLHSRSDSRFGGSPYWPEEFASQPPDLDLVNELHKQRPQFRLRRMMLK
jgi:hypothetical protein